MSPIRRSTGLSREVPEPALPGGSCPCGMSERLRARCNRAGIAGRGGVVQA
jgi:hypothetical protein